MESTEAADRKKAMRIALLGDESYRHETEGLRRRHGQQVHVYVRTRSRYEIMLQVDLLDTIASVKAMLENEEGRPARRQYLVYGHRILEDDRTLASYGIQKSSILSVEYPLLGGDDTQVLRGAGNHAQQQKRCSNYSRKAISFVILMGAAYKLFASASLSIGKIAFMVAIAAIVIADIVCSVKVTLAPRWGCSLPYLAVPWSIYLSGSLLVLASYLLLISFHKDYAYAIFPVPLPIVAAFVHHECKSRERRKRADDEADQAVDTEKADEDVLRGKNNDNTGKDHNSDEEEVQHFHGYSKLYSLNLKLRGIFRFVRRVDPLSNRTDSSALTKSKKQGDNSSLRLFYL